MTATYENVSMKCDPGIVEITETILESNKYILCRFVFSIDKGKDDWDNVYNLTMKTIKHRYIVFFVKFVLPREIFLIIYCIQ